MATSEARKKAAKLYQQQYPETTYPEALRIVSKCDSVSPLTAQIGFDPKGRPVRVNLEERMRGGLGAHFAIAGGPGYGKTTLLTLMAASMAADPPRRGVEIWACGPYLGQAVAGIAHTVAVAGDDLERRFDEEAYRRGRICLERGCLSIFDSPVPEPALVLLVDADWTRTNADWRFRLPAPLQRVGQRGRSVDAHLVAAVSPDLMLGGRYLGAMEMHVSSHIALTERGIGRWHRYRPGNDRGQVITEVTIPAPAG